MSSSSRHRRTLVRSLAVGVAGAAALAAAPVASAAVGLEGGSTSLRLAPGTAAALGDLGVSVAPVGPARVSGGAIAFPVTGGSIDPATAAGRIAHSGGLAFSAGGTTVRVTDFVVRTDRRTPVLTSSAPALSSTITYVVKPGDTLSAIAAKHKTTVRALATANRLASPNLVLEGARLRLPAAVASGPAQELSRSTVRAHVDKWATYYGIPISLARALAWQESGFQTNVTSSTGAWGPMQIMPDTWTFVETVLLGRTVPRTGEGGVEVGMALLHHLLKRFGGDQRLALAAWYQGERAVRERGLYDDTKTFVANVLALTGRPL